MPISEDDLYRITLLANQASSKVQSALDKRKDKELAEEHAQALMREETARLFKEVLVPTIQAYVAARAGGPAFLKITEEMPSYLNLAYHPQDPTETAFGPLNIVIGYEPKGAFRLEFVCDCVFPSGEKWFYLDLDTMTPTDIIAKLHQIFQRWDTVNGF
jgi:hypothetical protein